jgi:hypothetical protein
MLGYVSMNVRSTPSPTPINGLNIYAIPAYFDHNRTMIMDFSTVHAGIVVYSDALLIRSHYYISSYGLNTSSGHPDNLVSGDHCYVPVPVQNATLEIIGEVNNIMLDASGGSVTVRLLRNEPTIVQMQVNSTSTPTLTATISGLIPGDWYKVTMDSTLVQDHIYADVNGILTVSISGPWSSHELTITDSNPMTQFGPMTQWILILGVGVGLAAMLIVMVASRIKRG